MAVWPPSQDSVPVQPCATNGMWLVWKLTPKVGTTVVLVVPPVLVLLFGSTKNVSSSSSTQR